MSPFRNTWLWFLLLAVVMGTTLPTPALSEPYVRAGILLDRPQDSGLDKDCSSSFSTVLYGCETADDDAARSSLGDFGTMTGFEAGLGYALLPALRLELGVQYRPDFSFEGRFTYDESVMNTLLTAQDDISAELSIWSGMLAAYLDVPLPLLGLLRFTPINPFVGVGGGLSRITIGKTRFDIGDNRVDFGGTSAILPGDHQVTFSWMLTAGIAVSFAKWTVDAAWRYTNHGDIETVTGVGRKICRIAGCDLPDIDLPVPPTIGELRSHGITLSLRYAF